MKPDNPHDAIAVLDFGGQYVHLIATKVRALGVYAEIREPDDPVESFSHYKGLILSGSPALSAHDEDGNWSRGVMDLGIPVVGFCFGHQEIAKHAGGSVEHTRREYGAPEARAVPGDPLVIAEQRPSDSLGCNRTGGSHHGSAGSGSVAPGPVSYLHVRG